MDKVLFATFALVILGFFCLSAIEAGTGTTYAEDSASGTVTVNTYVDTTAPGTIAFGTVNPGSTDNAASANPYTISINSNTNVDTNITLKGDATFNWTTVPYATHSFLIGNLTYYHTNTVGSSYPMSTAGTTDVQRTALGYEVTAPSGGSQVDKSLYAWLDIPAGQYASNYNTTIYINVTAI